MASLPRMRMSAGDSSILAKVRRFCQRTYAFDYIGLGVLITGYVLLQLFVLPFHHMFFLDDLSIQYPFAVAERVNFSWLMIYSVGVPFAVMVAYLLLSRSKPHKWHVSILGLFISLFLTAFITDAIKNSVGRPRPDLIDRCKPKEGTPKDILVTIDICTQTNRHLLQDGWRSFPSGHSSFAFSGLGFLAFFLCGQLHVFRPHSDLTRGLLGLVPLLGAALIAISRWEDYRHGVYDVSAGSLLGLIVAHFAYRKYFPPLRSSRCDTPFPVPGDAIIHKEPDIEMAHAGEFELANDDESEEHLPLHSAQN